MEELDDLLYDDVEAKFLALENKKKKRKKRRRKLRLLVLSALLIFGVLYFSSDVSKVSSLQVSGNRYYREEQILEGANLSYESRYILHPSLYLKWKLEKLELVKEAEIRKDMDGRISIYITEKKILGYFADGKKSYVLLDSGEQVEIHEENLNSIVYYPLIDGFSKEQLEKLAKAFKESEQKVSEEVISMISEIHPHEESYDKNMLKVVMQDGNTIYTSYDSLSLLGAYKNMLKKLKGDHVCFIMDIQTNSYTTEDCASFQ